MQAVPSLWRDLKRNEGQAYRMCPERKRKGSRRTAVPPRGRLQRHCIVPWSQMVNMRQGPWRSARQQKVMCNWFEPSDLDGGFASDVDLRRAAVRVADAATLMWHAWLTSAGGDGASRSVLPGSCPQPVFTCQRGEVRGDHSCPHLPLSLSPPAG